MGVQPVTQTVYLNGGWSAIDEAKVSVLDRGFIFGDGVYEVVPVYHGQPFRWPSHLARLKRSLAKIAIDNPLTDEAWLCLVQDLVSRHPWINQFIYLQVTRGVAKRDHAFPKAVRPTVFGMSSELLAVEPALRTSGVPLITLHDERWLHCDIKSTSLLGNVLARQACVEADAVECIMFRDGMMTEGSSSNIWVVREGVLIGAPTDHLILEGIRVGLMAELAASAGVRLEFRRLSRAEVATADEIFISSATKEVLAARSLDGQLIGRKGQAGRPGPVFERIYAAYQDAIALTTPLVKH
jgi:D-alanine transaminase